MNDTKLCDYVESNEKPQFIKEANVGNEELDLFLLDVLRQRNYLPVTAADISDTTGKFTESRIQEKLVVFEERGLIEKVPDGFKTNNDHPLMELLRQWFRNEMIHLD